MIQPFCFSPKKNARTKRCVGRFRTHSLLVSTSVPLNITPNWLFSYSRIVIKRYSIEDRLSKANNTTLKCIQHCMPNSSEYEDSVQLIKLLSQNSSNCWVSNVNALYATVVHVQILLTSNTCMFYKKG